MASKGPLTMARDNVIRVQTSQTLLAVNFRALTCIREMGLTNGAHVTLSGNGKLRIVTTMLEETSVLLSVLTREGRESSA